MNRPSAAAPDLPGPRRSVLAALLRAVRDMPLDPVGVVELALDAVEDLGYRSAGLFALDEDGDAGRARPVVVRGADFDPAAAIAAVVGSGESAIIGSVIAAPVWTDGWLSGMLIARDELHAETRRPDESLEALGLLAAATGAALQNAQRFELERRTVERLEQLDRMKSDFVATVSHELRTPITAIQGTGLTLERAWRELDHDTRDTFLHSLNERTASLAELVGKLLDVSDLDAGGTRLQMAPVDMSELLAVALDRFEHSYPDRAMRSDVMPGLVVHGDARLLARVVGQLLSNAATHTPDRAAVTLSAGRSDDAVVVSVADEGPGFPPEDLARVGERFHRGGELNERASGLGLGLALATEILLLHDSCLQVESHEGAGARFWFSLPTEAS